MTGEPILVADDSTIGRTALAGALDDAGFDVVASTGSVDATVDAIDSLDPTTAVVSWSIVDDGDPDDVLETGVPIVALVAADRSVDADVAATVPIEVDGVLGSTGVTASVVETVESVTERSAAARWERVMADLSELGSRDVAVGGREFAPRPTLLVGASTGGPSLVKRLFDVLPREAGFRAIAVQHIREGFGDRFVGRLDAGSDYDVVSATDGTRLRGGQAAAAIPGQHLEVRGETSAGLALETTDDPPMHGVKPAIDPAFRTAAAAIDGRLVAVQLTGMGRDGAEGIRAVAEAGGTTIVQEPSEATVSSMPQAAIDTGVVDRVLPFEEIGEAIVDAVTIES